MAGEIVKARKNLKQLREEIVVVAGDLSKLREETDGLMSEKVSLEKEVFDLRETIKGLLSDIADRLSELRRLGVNIEDKHDVARRLDTILVDVDTKWRELETQFDVRTFALNRVNEDILEKERLLGERQTAYDSLGKDLDVILAEKATAETLRDNARRGATKAKELHQQIMATIHEAMERFRVFERRIARFSKDTGYVVGYPKPQKLLDNETDHETGIQQ